MLSKYGNEPSPFLCLTWMFSAVTMTTFFKVSIIFHAICNATGAVLSKSKSASHLGAIFAKTSDMIVVQIQGNLVWKFCQTKRGNFIGVCEALRQTVQAASYRELLETMNEALDSTFRELLSTGDLPKFLRDMGWTTVRHVPRAQRNIRFDMPFEVKRGGTRTHDFQTAPC